MKRFEVEYRPEARSDIDRLYFSVLFISHSLQTADQYFNRLYERCESIGSAPHGGKRCGPTRLALRMVPFERSAIILYRVGNELVEVTRIFSSRSDYLKVLADLDEHSS